MCVEPFSEGPHALEALCATVRKRLGHFVFEAYNAVYFLTCWPTAKSAVHHILGHTAFLFSNDNRCSPPFKSIAMIVLSQDEPSLILKSLAKFV